MFIFNSYYPNNFDLIKKSIESWLSSHKTTDQIQLIAVLHEQDSKSVNKNWRIQDDSEYYILYLEPSGIRVNQGKLGFRFNFNATTPNNSEDYIYWIESPQLDFFQEKGVLVLYPYYGHCYRIPNFTAGVHMTRMILTSSHFSLQNNIIESISNYIEKIYSQENISH
jgi:hypothetical protein